ALAVAHHDHVVEDGIPAARIELLDDSTERGAELARREQDRLARVVGEEPEVDAVAALGVILGLVAGVRPAGRARSRTVDEHDRYSPWPVGVEHDEGLGRWWSERRQEAPELGVPDGGTLELISQCSGGLELERHATPGDLDGVSGFSRV